MTSLAVLGRCMELWGAPWSLSHALLAVLTVSCGSGATESGTVTLRGAPWRPLAPFWRCGHCPGAPAAYTLHTEALQVFSAGQLRRGRLWSSGALLMGLQRPPRRPGIVLALPWRSAGAASQNSISRGIHVVHKSHLSVYHKGARV